MEGASGFDFKDKSQLPWQPVPHTRPGDESSNCEWEKTHHGLITMPFCVSCLIGSLVNSNFFKVLVKFALTGVDCPFHGKQRAMLISKARHSENQQNIF